MCSGNYYRMSFQQAQVSFHYEIKARIPKDRAGQLLMKLFTLLMRCPLRPIRTVNLSGLSQQQEVWVVYLGSRGRLPLLCFFESKLGFSTTDSVVIGWWGAEQLRWTPQYVHLVNCSFYIIGKPFLFLIGSPRTLPPGWHFFLIKLPQCCLFGGFFL